MAKQRYINTKMWSDNYFSELDPIEKLVFLYLLTNMYTNLCGIYEIPLKNISFDTGIEKQMIEKIIGRFTRDKKIRYIDWYICIRNFIKNQNMNPSVEKWIEREINEKPKEIVDKVWQIYNLYTGCIQEGTLNLTLTKPKPIGEPEKNFSSIKNILDDKKMEEEWGLDILQEFVDHWSETDSKWNELWTKQKTWNTNLRLKKWKKNRDTNFGRKQILDYEIVENFHKWAMKDEWDTIKDFFRNKYKWDIWKDHYWKAKTKRKESPLFLETLR